MILEWLRARVGNQVSWKADGSKQSFDPFGKLAFVNQVSGGIKVKITDVQIEDSFGDFTLLSDAEFIVLDQISDDSVKRNGDLLVYALDKTAVMISAHWYDKNLRQW